MTDEMIRKRLGICEARASDPGTRYTDLAARFSCSRSTVRDALARGRDWWAGLLAGERDPRDEAMTGHADVLLVDAVPVGGKHGAIAGYAFREIDGGEEPCPPPGMPGHDPAKWIVLEGCPTVQGVIRYYAADGWRAWFMHVVPGTPVAGPFQARFGIAFVQ